MTKLHEVQAEIFAIDKEYGSLCQTLGDAILRKEFVDLQIGTIRAQVQNLRNRRAEIGKALAERPAQESPVRDVMQQIKNDVSRQIVGVE